METSTVAYSWSNAVATSNFERVKICMKDKNFHIDQKFENGSTALFLAIEKNQLEMAKFLIDNGAEVNCKHDNLSYYSTVQYGADAYDVDPRGTILTTPLHHAIEQRNFDAVELLLQHNADLKFKARTGFPLQVALCIRNRRMIKLLLSYGADANGRVESNFFPLHVPFALKHPQVRDMLVSHGADVHACIDDYGRDTLYHALIWSESEFIEYLLRERGFSAKQVDKCAMTPMHFMLDEARQLTRLSVIAKLRLLIEHGADLNAVDRRKLTPLHYAAVNGSNAQVVEFMLNAGALLELPNTYSPISDAIAAGHSDVVESFIRMGARLDVQVKGRQSLMRMSVAGSLYTISKDRTRPYDDPERWKVVELLLMNGLTIVDEDLEKLSKEHRQKLEAYRLEFDRLKSQRVCDQSDVTYLDLLVKRENELVRCLNNPIVREAAALAHYKTSYKLFCSALETNLSRGFARMEMLKLAIEILSATFSSLLPYDVSSIILAYFSDQDLKVLLALE